MITMHAQISQFTPRLVLTGLALTMLGAGPVPLLDGRVVAAAEVQTVTRSFSSTTDTITVSGLEQGRILDVNVVLHGVSTNYADAIDLLLVHGDTNLILMSDAGGGNAASDLTLKFDDSAAAELPDETALSSGTFLPTNHVVSGADYFPAAAPVPSGNASLAAFNGLDPNGAWQFYRTLDGFLTTGTIDSWEVQITAQIPATPHPRSRRDTPMHHHHHSGHGKGKGKAHSTGHNHRPHR
jgi:hypothetical protein